ncbi:energy transducer TonB [Novosphingobium sp.]|uniref:energy transducer TonB n=1 Tax=Novosphingobium sp. TaxID=1874826 RepID=UPI002732486A|nr:energy transducer TonB [Novosphingobium sp.]MDP3907025.1 energy transducer TonB [Novosphingobium sp.]
MAYVDTHTSNHRIATLTTVALIHVAAGFALVNGLGASFMPQAREIIRTFDVDLPKPKPVPTPTEQPVAADPRPAPNRPAPNPADPFAFTATGPAPTFPTGPVGEASGGGLGEALFPTPAPTPAPGIAPRAARPKGNPALWVSTSDYPSAGIRGELEGLVKVRLTIGADGKPGDCTVTASSGHDVLDDATCAKLLRRARFDPASDQTGAKVAGTWTTAVRWDIPD